ncbi:MAG: AAA family ATPase, partial [Nanoarchaeota archaeon]|nr:AAA family ATPase [Nanoarchaeota archaeon]
MNPKRGPFEMPCTLPSIADDNQQQARNVNRFLREIPYSDRITYFDQINHIIHLATQKKNSPVITVVKANWGAGKTALGNIIADELREKGVKVRGPVRLIELLEKEGTIDAEDGEVLIIDEVEEIADNRYMNDTDKRREIIDPFVDSFKQLTGKNVNSLVVMLATPSGYEKVFGPGGIITNYISETYPAIKRRIDNLNLDDPTKLEYLALIVGTARLAGANESLVPYLDFLYYTAMPKTRANIALIVRD